MKTSICTVLVAATLALSGNGAMAATHTLHKTASAKPVHARVVTRHVVGHRRVAHVRVVRGPRYAWFDFGQFIQAMLGGGPVPYGTVIHSTPNNWGAESSSYDDSSTYDSSPSYDSSPAVSAPDTSAQDAITEDNSMQAVQEQNDEANAETNAGLAAAEQTEINSGM